MMKCVILERKEWDRLPVVLGDKLAEFAAKGYGFKVVSRESGGEITGDDLTNFLVGVMSTVFKDAVEAVQAK